MWPRVVVMETAVVIPYSFTYTILELLTKFLGFRPRRMARREGEETSGIGLTGMLSLPYPLGGGEGASPCLTELGGAGSSKKDRYET